MNTINKDNLSEVKTYKELFAIQESLHMGMDNATYSLLDAIPSDVMSIADVGAGPGLVNQYIPSKIHVIAIDIDEEILKRNRCETMLGDILNLPLKDDSVDMAIACDVLEHIDPKELDKAVSEMKRVARKYVYLQTPYEEILRYSIAFCPKCKNKWHVNFHKNVFRKEDYFAFEDNEWKIQRINYTGFVDNQKENPQLYKKITDENIDVYRVKGFKCPKCGTEAVEHNIEILYELEQEYNSSWRASGADPQYSEIGILLCRTDCEPEFSNDDNQCVQKEDCSYNLIDFSKKICIRNSYSGKEQVPFIIVSSPNNQMTANGLSADEALWVTAYFPYETLNDKRIKVESRGSIKIYSFFSDGREVLIAESLEGKKEEYVTVQSDSLPGIRIYMGKGSLLKKISICYEEKHPYYFYCTNDQQRHLYRTYDDGIYTTYLIPPEGVSFQNNLFDDFYSLFVSRHIGNKKKIKKISEKKFLIGNKIESFALKFKICFPKAAYIMKKMKLDILVKKIFKGE